MLKKTITYTDYDGNQRTEDLYFNLNKAEIAELELETPGGLSKKLEDIVAEKDSGAMVKVFKDLILRSYGKKSADGRQFIKNKELVDEFKQTEAFSELFMELASDPDAATAFVNGIIPKDLQDAANDAIKSGKAPVLAPVG